MSYLSEEIKNKAQQLRDKMSWRELARQLNVPKSTLSDYLRKGKVEPTKEPKILLIDVETSPMVAFVWQRWKANISQEQLIRESNILTYTAKWLGSTQAIINAAEATDTTNDYDMVKEMRDLLDECDIVVAFNGIRFDVPVINARILYHGLAQPSPYKIIDPMTIAKKQFRFSSNSMDAIAAYFNLDRKLKHAGFSLWKRAVAGEQEAIDEMLEYNIQDVVILEQVYLKLRPWSTTLPSLAVIKEENCCPCCGSTDIKPTDKFHITNVSKYPLFVCDSCGKFHRSRVNVLKRSDIGVSV
jgi:hypothetical protein